MCVICGFLCVIEYIWKMANGIILKMFTTIFVISCWSLACLFIFSLRYNDTKGISIAIPLVEEHKSVIKKLQNEALEEVGLTENINRVTFKFPIVPLKGYRDCLNGSNTLSWTRSHSMLYLGIKEDICQGCVKLNMTLSFSNLSTIVCRSRSLYCGLGSTFLCGLLAMSTKTILYVNLEELNTWPWYMKDYEYGNLTSNEIERNHRMVIDRHTIKQSHPLLLSKLAKRWTPGSGYNLIVYAREDECNEETPKENLCHEETWETFWVPFG